MREGQECIHYNVSLQLEIENKAVGGGITKKIKIKTYAEGISRGRGAICEDYDYTE